MSARNTFSNLSVVFEVGCYKLFAKMEEVRYFQRLPEEMLEIILKQLTLRDVASLHAAFPDENCYANAFPWRHVTVEDDDGYLTRNIGAVAKKKAKSLQLPVIFFYWPWGPEYEVRTITAMLFTDFIWDNLVSLELGCTFRGMGARLPRSLQHLSLLCSGSQGTNECDEIAALVNLPQLKHLVIRGQDFLPTETDSYGRIVSYNFKPLHPLAAKLEVLHIDTSGSSPDRVFKLGGLDLGENCNLKVLKISAHLLLPGVEHGRFESIQNLSLPLSYWPANAEIGDGWFGQFPNLTNFGVQASKVTDWQGIPGSLHSLDLELLTTENRAQDGFFYDTLSLLRFRDLKFLSLRYNKHHGRPAEDWIAMYDSEMWELEDEAIISLQHLATLENLETLVITGCFDLMQRCVDEVFPLWTSSLKHIVIKQEKYFFHPWTYAEFFSDLFVKFPELQTLSFVRDHCEGFETVRSLVSALEIAPNLVMISFSNHAFGMYSVADFKEFERLLPNEWKSAIINGMCVGWRRIPRPTTINVEARRLFLPSDVAFRCNFFPNSEVPVKMW